MAYAPAGPLNFDFASAAAGSLAFEFNPVGSTQTVAGIGSDCARFALAAVVNVAATVAPRGTGFSVFGAPFASFHGTSTTTVPVGIAAPPLGTLALGTRALPFAFNIPRPGPIRGDLLHFQFLLGGAPQQLYPYGVDAALFGAAYPRNDPRARPAGIDSARFGATRAVNKSDLAQTVVPVGVDTAVVSIDGTVGRALRFKFDNPSYAPPAPVGFDFVLQGGTRGIFVALGELTAFGTAATANKTGTVLPAGIPPGQVGAASQLHDLRRVAPAGAVSRETFGAPVVTLYWRRIYPLWPVDASVTATRVDNFIRYLQPEGFAATLFGTASLPDYYPRPAGIPPGVAGTPKVDPRIVYAAGFIATSTGTPNVQPMPFPVGFDALRLGRPTVADNRQYVGGTGLLASTFGQPTAHNTRRAVLAAALVESGVFGDVAVRNASRQVRPPTVDDGFISPFASLRNRNACVVVYGIVPGSLGAATQVANAARSLAPAGIVSLAVGRTEAGWRVRAVYPTGLGSGQVPAGAAVVNRGATVAPRGIAPAGDPQAGFVAPRVREIRDVGGRAVLLLGVPLVTLARRPLYDVGGSDLSAYGQARIEYVIRTVPVVWFGGTVIDPPVVTDGSRAAAPAGIFYDPSFAQFGVPYVVFGLQRVEVPGAFVGTFGAPTAARNERRVAPDPITGAVPPPDVQLRRRYVVPRDAPDQAALGVGSIYNARQYVVELFTEEVRQLLGAVGVPWGVANRNRVIGGIGTDTSGVSRGAAATLAARALGAVGSDLARFGAALVAPRVRTLALAGLEPGSISPYHQAHNNLRVIAPSGIARLFPGVPRVFDNSQRVDCNGTRTLFVEFGEAFVAPRVRTVDLDDHHRGISAPLFADHDAALRVRYVGPFGFTLGAGGPAVEHHRNLVAPHGAAWTLLGEPWVRNVRPQAWPPSWLSDDFGKPYVGPRLRRVDLAGQGAGGAGETMPRPHVEYRTRSVQPAGWSSLRIVLLHDVRFDAPVLPDPQSVFADSLNAGALGTPLMNQRGVLALGFGDSAFGRPVVATNVIRDAKVLFNDAEQFGTPSLNVPLTVVLRDIDSIDGFASGNARLNPVTIWISEPPSPPFTRRPNSIVDEFLGATYPWWGNAGVTLGLRQIFVAHDPYSTAAGERFGALDASLRHRRLYLDGIPPRRVGVPEIPTGAIVKPYWGRDTEDYVEGEGYDTAAYGAASLLPPPAPPSPYVRPQGFVAGAFGVPVDEDALPGTPRGVEVMLLNRVIRPASFYTTVFTGWNFVHFPMPLQPAGIDSVAIGDAATISYRIRQVFPVGTLHNRFAEPSYGYQAMRVWTPHFVQPGGIAPGAVSIPGVANTRSGRVIALVSAGATTLFGRPRLGDCPLC